MMTTTAPRARGSAAARSHGTGSSRIRGEMARTAAAPPTAEANVPTKVTPICTVARKRSGSSWSDATRFARPSPSAASCWIRLRRAEIRAISAPAKKPFSRMKIPMRIASCHRVGNTNASMSHSVPIEHWLLTTDNEKPDRPCCQLSVVSHPSFNYRVIVSCRCETLHWSGAGQHLPAIHVRELLAQDLGDADAPRENDLDALGNRQLGQDNVFPPHQHDVSQVQVIGGNINGHQGFRLAAAALQSDLARQESEAVPPLLP